MRTLSRLAKIAWGIAYATGFGLSVRLLVASFNGAAPNQAPLVTLALGSFSLAVWRPRLVMLAFLIAMPVLCGLGANGLLSTSQPATFTFSAILVGLVARHALDRFLLNRSPLGCNPANLGTPVLAGRPHPLLPDGAKNYLLDFVGSLIALAVVTTLLNQLFQHPQILSSAEFWRQPVFGFTDSFYFLTSAIVWIHGLIFFSELVLRPPAVLFRVIVRIAFAVLGVSLVLFVFLQHLLWLPVPLNVGAGSTSAYYSPFEDIHSFGSFAVAGLMYALGSWRPATRLQMCAQSIVVLAWVAETILSWSRASWLAGMFGFAIIATVRMPRRWFLGVCLLGIAVIVVTNLNADRASWNRYSYVERFIALVRIENPSRKDSSRVFLYRRALRMICERPLNGHGIGSFRGTSLHYAEAADPDRNKSDFTHDFLLQLAAELGLPVTLLFGGLIGTALVAGWRQLKSRMSFQKATGEAMGTTLALTAYLQTQLTANSLNVYSSNQFFFWFLLAALLAFTRYPAAWPERQPTTMS